MEHPAPCYHLLWIPSATASCSPLAVNTHSTHQEMKVLLLPWAVSTSLIPQNKSSLRQRAVFIPEESRDTALIISATGEQSLGQRRFHLQVTLRVLDAPQSALGVHRAFKALESQHLPEAPSSHSSLTLPTPRYSPFLQYPAHLMGKGKDMGLGGMIWGRSREMQDLVRVDVPPIPSPLPRENEPSIPHFSLPSLPRSGPQQLSAASSWPWSPFYLLSTLPAQEGGEEPGWSGDCAPATTACLDGTATRQALFPSVPCGLGVLLPQPSPSRAGAKRCLVPG